jgi:hypothetical protein
MAASAYNFEIEQGADLDITFARKNPAGGVIGMTGFTARMQVRASIISPDILLDLTTENGRLAINEAAGEVRIILNAATTSAIQWPRGVYDMELVSPTGGVSRMLYGEITVSKEVTR